MCELPVGCDVPAPQARGASDGLYTLGPRKARISSAMIEMAISCGLWAPMLMPIGEWMRLISSSLKPAPFSRSVRLAWLRLARHAPIGSASSARTPWLSIKRLLEHQVTLISMAGCVRH